ncbi:MAG: DUF4870 domain-containing protein [Saonia sp.]
MDTQTVSEGKTIAIISYITLVGTLIAYLMNNDKKNEFAKFHIGQALRAGIAGIVCSFIGTILVMMTGIGIFSYLGYAGLVFAILGLMNVINGKAEKLPIIGTMGE